MSIGSSHGTVLARIEPLPTIRWRAWPLRERPFLAATTIAGLALLAVFVRWSTGAVHLALLAVLAAGLALCRFFIPTRYELSAEGIGQWMAGRERRIPWHAVRCYEVFDDGVILFPEPNPRPLDAFHGLFLPWADRRQEILAQIHHYLGEPEWPPRR